MAAPDPSAVAQAVAAAQSAAIFESETTAPVDVSTRAEPYHGDAPNTVQLAETGDFGTLEVDTGSDRDSAFDDDYNSFTTSIRSTATDYRYEHGRRYHAYGDDKYMLPNDNKEISRLELQHQVWQLSMHGKLVLAPITRSIRTALDIGCGTGAWAIEFAEQNPNCRVIGADLSPIQPTMVPPNTEFIVDDIMSPWVYDTKFDYIHSRAMTVAIKDWSFVVQQMWDSLEPGGWVEFQEFNAPLQCDDTTMEEYGPNFTKWNRNFGVAASKAGTRVDAITSVPEILQQRGFINIATAATKWPSGRWAKGRRAKKIGEVFEQDLAGNLEGVSLRLFTKVLGWPEEEVTTMATEASKEVFSGKMHVYMPIKFVYAQKPLT